MMNRAKNLETILTLCVALIVLFFIFQIKLLLTLSVLLGFIGMFSHYLSGKIVWGWMKLSEGLGFITSKTLLTVVFFLVLFPLAMLSRLFRKDNLQLKKTNSSSYYVIKNHEFIPKDFENMW